VVASANPVVVRSCVVGLVVGVGRLVEVLTSRGILGGSSGVEAGGGLSVKGREHFVLRCKHCFGKEWSPFFIRLTILPRALCDGTAPTASHHHPPPPRNALDLSEGS
jgi:hypothetical protein